MFVANIPIWVCCPFFCPQKRRCLKSPKAVYATWFRVALCSGFQSLLFGQVRRCLSGSARRVAKYSCKSQMFHNAGHQPQWLRSPARCCCSRTSAPRDVSLQRVAEKSAVYHMVAPLRGECPLCCRLPLSMTIGLECHPIPLWGSEATGQWSTLRHTPCQSPNPRSHMRRLWWLYW